jgi:hypothetical protein
MKTRTLMITVTVLILATGSAIAQMGGGYMGGGHMGGWNNWNNLGPGPGPNPGPNPGTNPGSNPGTNPGPGWGHMGYGMGYGTAGAGGMVSGMMGNTVFYGYLDDLNPIPDNSPTAANTAFEVFIASANSSLKISEIWEYGIAYKAELEDANGNKAFDLIADKFTGAVGPEMGFSMMMNASYGKGLYNVPKFPKNLIITPDQAISYAEDFVARLGYTLLEPPEIYPGYYKFHTNDGTGPGIDIMVNGYNGRVWMNTLLGVPVAKYEY